MLRSSTDISKIKLVSTIQSIKNLKMLLDKILTDERWDLKFIGMQIIIEGLALSSISNAKGLTKDPLLEQLLHYVIRDEARHVTFGINYLEDFVKTLSPEEVEERAEFAYEACVISRERLINTVAMQKYLKCQLKKQENLRSVQQQTQLWEFLIFKNHA